MGGTPGQEDNRSSRFLRCEGEALGLLKLGSLLPIHTDGALLRVPLEVSKLRQTIGIEADMITQPTSTRRFFLKSIGK